MKLTDRLARWRDLVRFRAGGVQRSRLEQDFDDELRFHLEEATDQHLARGVPRDAAERLARRELGVPVAIKEDLRAERGVDLVDGFVQDVRYGMRLMRRNPGFALAGILTIALGIDATTAVFGVVDGVVLRPMPYPESERLVNLWSTAPRLGLPRSFVGAANYRDWRTQNTVFEEIALVRHIGNFNLVGAGAPERLQGARITASLFNVLRVAPAIGRPFREDEEQVGREQVVILSDGLWTRRFGRDPSIVGRTIVLNNLPHVVVGVMPRGFAYPGREFEIWVPLAVDPDDYRTRLSYSFLSVGRLKPGVAVASAQAEMDTISARLAAQYPDANRDVGAIVAPMRRDVAGDVRTPLLVLLGGVTSLLLIGCASLANLLIARASSRSGELVLRSALGAGRGRLVRQSISELMPLLVTGGVAGVLLAYGLLTIAIPLLPATMPRVEGIGVDSRVLAFAGVMLALTGLSVGVWPALHVARWDIASALRASLRGTTAFGSGRLRDALVVAQIGAALLLAVSATLLMRSFAGVSRIDPGFKAEGVTTLHLAIPRGKYPRDREVVALCRAILERVRQSPGVTAAGMVNRLPLAGGAQVGVLQLDRSALPSNIVQSVDWRTATPEYFAALGIPLIEGRTFTDADDEQAPLVGLVDERLARVAWPNESPIGRRFRIPVGDLPWITIVGVVGHLRHDGLTVDPRPQVYWNYLQRPQDRMALVVRGTVAAEAMARAAVVDIHAVDPDQPVYDVRPMTAVVDRSLADRWLTTSVLTGFAVVALFMAAIGVYGVVSYAVGQRAREFGIRIALGAAKRDVLWLVMRRGALLVLIGVSAGTAVALVATRALEQLLHHVSRTDWVSFSAAAAILAVIALAATLLPARRALAGDPSVVLRS